MSNISFKDYFDSVVILIFFIGLTITASVAEIVNFDRYGLTREVKQEYKKCEKSLTLRSSKCYLKVVNPEEDGK